MCFSHRRRSQPAGFGGGLVSFAFSVRPSGDDTAREGNEWTNGNFLVRLTRDSADVLAGGLQGGGHVVVGHQTGF